MKTFVIIRLTAMLSVPSFAQSRTERREAEAARIMEMVSDTVYTISVSSALPMGWKTVNLTSVYTLEVAKDSIISHLPYFGRAYSIPYGGGKGLMFEGKAKDYSVSDAKGGGKDIEFSVMNEEDNYTFNVTVYPNGSAYVNVNSNRRQPISYIGRIEKSDDR